MCAFKWKATPSIAKLATEHDHLLYGDVWYETGTPNKWKFTGYERDAESEPFDYADFRHYANLYGRFTSPDKLAGNLGNPQSLEWPQWPAALALTLITGCHRKKKQSCWDPRH
jgi:RHS repeat-associated protein